MDESQREAIREGLLQRQQAVSQYGTVFYEAGGLGTCDEVSGEIVVGQDGFLVFADPALLATEQHTIFIPVHRIIRVEYRPV